MESSRSRYANQCAICGKPARVYMGTTAYCLDCYNRISDYLAEVDSPTNDSYSILALDPSGRTVEFAVERMAFGLTSVWTAVEQVADDDPRKAHGYVGRRVSIAADSRLVPQEEALDALMVKAQRLVGHASIRATQATLGQIGSSLVRQGGPVLFANETGVARIEVDEHDKTVFVIDGQQYSPEQFAHLMSCYEGHDLFWQVRDSSDETPAWL